MSSRSGKLYCGSSPVPLRRRFRASVLLLTAAALMLALQSSCLFRKSKAPKPAPPTVRVVFLPFNTPAANKDLAWTAMASPIMMALVSDRARDLDAVPLWQTMPTALEAAGASRTINAEAAANVAAWFSAKWSAMGEFIPEKRGVTMIIDFIPARGSMVAFRYMKKGTLDAVGSHFPDVFKQFLHYLAVRPPLEANKKEQDFSSLRSLAEALDREYGWSVEAQPGKAQLEVSKLASSDMRLARLLFNPTLYPLLAPQTTD